MIESPEDSKLSPLKGYVVSVLIVAYFAILIGTNLDVNPGLHGDEAWFGLSAAQMLGGMTGSLHGMTWYTGALFPYLLVWVFRAVGISVWSLRCLGVAANLCAIFLFTALVFHLYRRLPATLVLALLFASSGLVAAESRVAWEVTALNPLFAACLLVLAVFFLEPRETRLPGSRLAVAAFLSISLIGVYNHIIFLSLVFALFVASLLAALRFHAQSTRFFLFLSGLALGDAVMLVSIERLLRLSQQRFLTVIIVGLFWSGIAVQPFALKSLSERLDTLICAALGRFARPIRNSVWALSIVGAVAFVEKHLFAFIQVLSNDVLLRRLYSVNMRWPILGISYAYALFILGTYLTILFRCLKSRLTLRPSEYFLLMLPLATICVLPAFLRDISIRYYLLANLVLIVALVVAYAHLNVRQRRYFLAVLVAYALIFSATLIPITVDRRHYESVPPEHFLLGYRFNSFHLQPGQETSAHFFSMNAVMDRLQLDRIRSVRTGDKFFIGNPLAFYFLIYKWEGDPHETALIDYDYGRPGGFSYRVLHGDSEGEIIVP